MIGLDTSAIIDLFRGDESIKKALDNADGLFAATKMNYLELMFGLDPGNPKHKAEGEYYDDFFKSVLCLALDNRSCKKASEIFWRLRKEGKEIEQFDCVIAGIFLANGINKIITRNAKHYSNISVLKVISY